jgi:single-strand DNA-binding protein
MASYNRVVLIGNLTRDPEYKQLTSGQAVCRLGLAMNRQFKNKQTGSMVQEVCYVDVDVWGPQAESSHQYLQKGRPVLVEGRLKLDSWQDAQGQNRSKHSIVADRVVFLGSGQTAETTSSMDDMLESPRQEATANPLEKEILDQIEAIKNKPKAKAKATGAVKATGNQSEQVVDFKDEPPFQDELPF